MLETASTFSQNPSYTILYQTIKDRIPAILYYNIPDNKGQDPSYTIILYQIIKDKKNLLSIKIGDIYHMTNNAQHLLSLCQVREWIRLAGFPLLSQTSRKTKLKDSFWSFQPEVGLVHAPWSCGGAKHRGRREQSSAVDLTEAWEPHLLQFLSPPLSIGHKSIDGLVHGWGNDPTL